MTSSSTTPNFMKKLAANEKSTRDRALDSLRTYLRTRSASSLTPLELLKLWKGLFYCMWMSDKPRNQQQLARDLADLVDIVPEPCAAPFLEAFWQTMAREWNGIGQLRMDKFLYLVRRYLYVGFRWCARQGFRGEKVEELLDVLRNTPLDTREPRIPNGMRYHVIDIYIDEMENVENEFGNLEMPYETILEPLVKMRKHGLLKTVRERACEALDDERVSKWLGRDTEDSGEEQEEEEREEEAEADDDGEEQEEADFHGFDD